MKRSRKTLEAGRDVDQYSAPALGLGYDLVDDLLAVYPHLDRDVVEDLVLNSGLARAATDFNYNAHETGHELEAAKKESRTDGLTGLPNREGFIHALIERIEDVRAVASEQLKTAVVFIDLDGFKDLNDALGHEEGDNALISVAERLSDAMITNSGDMVARIGGDEIVLLLQDNAMTEEFSNKDIMFRIREALEGLVYYNDNGVPYPIGASIGITTFDYDRVMDDIHDHDTMRELVATYLKEADINMYANKWGPEGKLGDGTAADNPDAPKFERLSLLKAAALQTKQPTIIPPVVVSTGSPILQNH